MKNQKTKPSTRLTDKKRRLINAHIAEFCIVAGVVLVSIGLAAIVGALSTSSQGTPQSENKIEARETTTETQKTQDVAKYEPTEATTEPSEFYTLTSEQRTLIEQVVSAESRGEPYDGQVAVAQCILNACLKDNITPEQAIKKYKYTTARVEPTESVKAAVAAVFDRGEGITDEPILYFYNPALVESEFHESQILVVEIANHRFFKEQPEK